MRVYKFAGVTQDGVYASSAKWAGCLDQALKRGHESVSSEVGDGEQALWRTMQCCVPTHEHIDRTYSVLA